MGRRLFEKKIKKSSEKSSKKVRIFFSKKGRLKVRQKGSNDSIAEYCIMAKVQKKFKKKVRKKIQKKFKKNFEKKFAKKVQKYYKLLEEGRRGGEGREGREGREGGELSFQCLRPSTSLMAAGKNYFYITR
jgi:hypothetical protein